MVGRATRGTKVEALKPVEVHTVIDTQFSFNNLTKVSITGINTSIKNRLKKYSLDSLLRNAIMASRMLLMRSELLITVFSGDELRDSEVELICVEEAIFRKKHQKELIKLQYMMTLWNG